MTGSGRAPGPIRREAGQPGNGGATVDADFKPAAVIAAAGWQQRLTVPWPGTSFDSWGELTAILMLVLLSVFMFRYSIKTSHGK